MDVNKPFRLWICIILCSGFVFSVGCNNSESADMKQDGGLDASMDSSVSDVDGNHVDDAGPDSSADLVSIASYGTTDLEYNRTPLPDPVVDLPILPDLDPVFSPALADQVLPGAVVEIYETDRVYWLMGFQNADALADALRLNGVVRQPVNSSRDLMSQAIISITEAGGGPAVLVTSDAVFNTFHNFYDNVLLGVELQTLRPRLLAMIRALKAGAARRYNGLPQGPTRDAALDVAAYLQVAESLMEPESVGIQETWDVASREMRLVHDFGEIQSGELEPDVPSPLFDRPEASTSGDPECVDCDPCMADPENGACSWYEGTGDDLKIIPCPERFCEDYSQYKPRGHYTYSEILEGYFRAMMWLGRMTFLNRSDQSTRGALVLIDSLKDSSVDIDGETVPAAEIWRQAIRAIGVFVGSMDDLNAFEIDTAVTQAIDASFSLDDLDDADVLDDVQDAIDRLRDPGILSGFLNSLADVGQATKGLRLLGQVYLPDSYALGQLVFGNIGPSASADPGGYQSALDFCGFSPDTDPENLNPSEVRCVCKASWRVDDWDVCRGIPSGLDVASVLGSEKAGNMAHERFDSYAGYAEKLAGLIDEFNDFDLARWGKSIAWTWLYALKALFEDVDPDAPAFMRTEAWENKNLETGLTSWATMRHDTILYAKQSYSSDTDADTDTDTDSDVDYDFDYVEPLPRAYARLEAATRRLSSLIVSDELVEDSSGSVMTALNKMETFLSRAWEISVAELEGRELSNSDISWIHFAGSTIHAMENQLLESLGIMDEEHEPDPDRLKTTIVADVHTWPDKEVVLEAGSGYLDYIAILHQLPAGQWGVAVGTAFTYHEFEHAMTDRLTDEQWRDLLEQDPDTGCPDWLE